MKFIRYTSIAMLVALFAFAALAATKGDQSPYGQYGVQQVQAYDAGTGAVACLGLPNQNSIMVRNWINDGGTTSTIYCGFDTSVTIRNGMPLQSQETLTVDVVSLTANFVTTPPTNIDGGPTTTPGTQKPKLCCVQAAGTGAGDLHWMIVR